MKITWLTQGGFLFEHCGKRLLVDPYMSDIVERKEGLTRLVKFPLTLAELKPNALLCTHNHMDHFDYEAVPQIAAAYPACVLAGSLNAYRHFLELGNAETRCQLLKIGEQNTLAGFTVLPVFAKHSDKEAVGVVIGDGGQKVYLSGDTLFDEQITGNPALKQLDGILICINGKLGNMTWEEAVQTVIALQPKTAVPMHYGLFAENTVDPQPFVDACHAAGINSFAPHLAVPFTL